VLRDVTLRCESGAFVGLIGPNGCGKSTLLRVLSGVLRTEQGSVLLDDRPLSGFSPRDIARCIAFVPQEEKAAFEFSVQDVVLMGRFPHRARLHGPSTEDYAHVERALIAADIVPLKHRAITELSGGEHRRVLLARALAQQTPLLLLDEPTAHLDITHQAELMQLTHDLTRCNGSAGGDSSSCPIGALAALHDLNQAAEYCDHLILMREGRILAQGTPEDVLLPTYLRAAYNAEAQIGRNPVTGRPMLFALKPVRETTPDLPNT
jgi:iron complex transport system ATP-binding protein